MKGLAAIAALLAISLLLVSCGAARYECTDPLGCLEIPSGEPVIIGTLLGTIGREGPAGTESLRSIRKAVADKDEILGHYIQLLNLATDCTPAGAQSAATEFAIHANLAAVIGPTCVEERERAGTILINAGIPLVGPVPDSRVAFALTNQVIAALERVAAQMPDKTIYIPRQALIDSLQLAPY